MGFDPTRRIGTRRNGVLTGIISVALLVAAPLPLSAQAGAPVRTEANVAAEITLTSSRPHAAPSSEVTVDVVFEDPAGRRYRVPAFWAGGRTWKVRYASPRVGAHTFRSECNVDSDRGLHGVRGIVEVRPYLGRNPLYVHGPIRVAADRRRFAYGDGTPFLWLGDTWWMGLCHRIRWPGEFETLTADRQAKGFNVVQIVAGLYPDMPPFDPRGANEAGFPWTEDYERIRPEYFDAADARLAHLIDSELTPCIVGAWGYFLPWMGVERAKQHWRHLIARYGAWPVVWCVAGEANLPYYLAPGFPFDDREQVRGWTEVTRYVRETDPFDRPLSIHPTGLGRLSARGATDDESLLDFDMLQTGHGGREVLGPSIATLEASLAALPRMPVLNSEVAYEALLGRIPAEVQRLVFWASLLSGAAGQTYGANGIWQCNRRDQPHGPSPHGGDYGSIPWDEAMHLPGSFQLGSGKKLLEELSWHRFETHPGWVAWDGAETDSLRGEWIWFPEGDPRSDAPVETRFFRRSFELPEPSGIRRATLRISADDRFTAWLNGREIGSGSSWKIPGRFEVRPALRPGLNVLAVRAENSPAPVTLNPAGLLASLVFESASGAPQGSILSGSGWRTSRTAMDGWREPGFDDSTWVPAAVIAPHGEGPWGTLEGTPPYLVPRAAGIEGGVRVVHVPVSRPIRLHELRPGARYRAQIFDPVTGAPEPGKAVGADRRGEWRVDPPDHGHDWVVVLEPIAEQAGRPR